LNSVKQNLKIQKYIAGVSVCLFLIKLLAWYLTNSVAILTDALESIVNVVAGFIGLYSLNLSAKPRDADHPYGHGKVEFISAAIEGILISVAGIFIIREAVLNLSHPHQIRKLDNGIYLVLVTAIINYAAGFYCVRQGKKTNSLAMISSGKHLISDTYTTAGIIVGLALMFWTNQLWIDSVVAIVFALIVFYTGFKIIRSSVAGMMDEADKDLLNNLVGFLNAHRTENWVDVHNLRVIKYGSMIHVDCHLTVPWYFNVNEAHQEIDKLSDLVEQHFGNRVELFIHSDGCLDFSCKICSKQACAERKHPYQKQILWDMQNVLPNKKHQIDTL
jgi:cation diffusion facilitator family transporter